MSADEKAPIIIKRKKVIAADGHHGGAWKVAYADFVTAMMAFFMLMWLLNATTEQQRKGLADYFTPTIAIARVSGGGDGAFGGDSMVAANTLPQNGQGGLPSTPTTEASSDGNPGNIGEDDGANLEDLEEVIEGLVGNGGESLISESAKKHINVRVTDKGLVIELFDLNGDPLFEPDTAKPTETLKELTTVMAELFQLVKNPVTIGAHTRSFAPILIQNPAWSLSAERANQQRLLLLSAGLPEARIEQLIGFGQQKPLELNSMAIENNRLEITLLRDSS
jgi:chemotaxis protein MotB